MTIQPGTSHVDIVFDGPPDGPEGPRFVEAEDPTGAGVTLSWVLREDGYWVLRVPLVPDPGPDPD